MGGTFSAEYGIDQVERDFMARYAAPGKIALMRAVKATLDPQGILNSGTVIV